MRPTGGAQVKTRRMCWSVIVALTILLAACALPRSGPSSADFARAERESSIRLVEATMADAAASQSNVDASFVPDWIAAPEAQTDLIGAGDLLSIGLSENDGLNLFPSNGQGTFRFDGLPVDPSGAIQLPYVGQVRVAGLTPLDARAEILKRLRRIVLSSDVTVVVKERHSRLLSVQGDVTHPGIVPLGPETTRLSRLLSIAGAAPANQELATVTVRRGSVSSSVPLVDIYERPAQDIAMQSGDVVIVRYTPAMVNVLGAAGMQGRVRITRRNYSLADAVADARGLNDSAASPGGVYLMRLGEAFGTTTMIPHVYHFDFRDPAQIAVASAFAVRDGDALLLSNAPFAQSHKILSAFSSVMSTARSATYVAP